jgi:hypothetical protein
VPAFVLARLRCAGKTRALELLVFFPALCAAIGGTYEHENALLIVLPAGLVIARVGGGRAVIRRDVRGADAVALHRQRGRGRPS